MSQEEALEALLEHLKTQRGFDFTGYKRCSLQRRVSKRMEDVGISDVTQYLAYLEANPPEFEDLFNTILINVTGFFRDPDAWTSFAGRSSREWWNRSAPTIRSAFGAQAAPRVRS